MGIGTMVREEKAVIYVTSQYLTESPLMPVIEHSQVQFEVELVHFIQVRDVLGDERLIKRRIRDGKVHFMFITRALFSMKKRRCSMTQELITTVNHWISVLEKGWYQRDLNCVFV